MANTAIIARDYQVEAVKTILQKWSGGVTRQMVTLPTGCHAAGTKLLMFDGNLKNVEDVKQGDLLMGPDSKPRKVLKLIRGSAMMYKIIPSEGESFVVNGAHVLSLIDNSGCVDNITVLDYLMKDKYYKIRHKLYRCGVEFSNPAPKNNPYKTYNGGFRLERPSFEELVSAQTYRRQLAAGILDGCGRTYTNYFRCAVNSKWLCEDILFLFRSLGFKAYVRCETKRYVVYIYGDFKTLPLRVKKPPETAENILTCGFSVKQLDIDDYYGFELDRDHLYLMGDFTVTHNSGKTIVFGLLAQKVNAPTLILAHREELLDQAMAKIAMVDDSLEVGELKSGHKEGLKTQICVASIQSAVQPSNMQALIKRNFKLVIVDEAHHCSYDNSYGKLFRALGVLPEMTKQEREAAIEERSRLMSKTITSQAAEQDRSGYSFNEIKDASKVHIPYSAMPSYLRTERSYRDKFPDRDDYRTELSKWRSSWIAEHYYEITSKDEYAAPAARKSESFESVKLDGKLNSKNSRLLLGVTATAFRGDNQALCDIFQDIVYQKTIITMIRAGYLSDAKALSVSTTTDLSKLHTKMGDFAVDELSKAVNTPQRNKLVVDSYKEYAKGRKALVFCCDIKHSQDMADEFKAAGIKAAAVWGAMGDVRQETLEQYSEGKLDALTNCNVLTEGYDDPSTSVVILARPTQSTVLFTQMVGRGLRTFPGKKECLVIDFADMLGRHNLCKLGDLTGELGIQLKNGQTLKQAVTEKATKEHAELISNQFYVSNANLFESGNYVWTRVNNGYKLMLSPTETLLLEKSAMGYTPVVLIDDPRFDALRKQGCVILYAKEPLSKCPMPIGYAQGIAENYAAGHMSGTRQTLSDKTAVWREQKATDKQLWKLKQLGVPTKPDITRGEASMMIEAEMEKRGANGVFAAKKRLSTPEPATENQLWFIRKCIMPNPDPKMTKTQASELIGKYKKEEEMLRKKY